MNDLRPRNRNRLTASAARNAKISAATRTMTTTTSEIFIASQNVGSFQTSRKFAIVPPSGRNVGRVVCSLFSGRSALLIIQ